MVWMLFLKVYDAKEDDWELNEDNYTFIIPDECRWRNWAQADDNGVDCIIILLMKKVILWAKNYLTTFRVRLVICSVM